MSNHDIAYLVLSLIVGYLCGSIPFAARLSSRKGIDIFEVGTGLAGASNVRRNVGVRQASFVVLGDAGKGMLAVLFARLVGVEGAWLALPTAAAVIGQWNSVFTRFKGGDGLVALGGATLVVFSAPAGYLFALAGVAVGIAVALGGQKMPYSSLFCIILGYAALVLLTRIWNPGELDTALAMCFIGVCVFVHAVFGHARRRATTS